MREVSIKIPDTKFNFFMELMKQLGFEVTHKYEIPEEHIAIVRERIKEDEANPDQIEDWDKVKDQFKLDM
ncbi:MAG: hypothetical protein ABIQ02_00165 [Saprospiraceae bacterium]